MNVRYKTFLTSTAIFLWSCSSALATTQITNLTASASSTNSGSNPQFAVDNNLSTNWNAGGGAPKWILLDLSRPATVSSLTLLTNQSSSGRSIYTIEAGATSTGLSPILTIDQITTNSQNIEIPFLSPLTNIRYIKITTQQTPSWVSWKEIKVYSDTNTANNHLNYFGYMSTDGLHTTVSPTYFEELSSLNNTNIAWTYIENLDQLAQLNIQGLLTDVKWKFFPDSKLNPNWQAAWASYQTKLKGHEDQIYGFYFDEPVWHGYSKADFLTATKAIHDAYPDKAIFVVEAEPPINNGTIPQDYYKYVTDIGFDYYFTNKFTDNQSGWGEYLSLTEKFKPYTVNKKYWVIPDGEGKNYPAWPDAFEKYVSFALTNPQVVGIFSFIYNGDTFPFTLRDVLLPMSGQYLPSFRTRQIQVGRAIIATNSVKPPIPTGIPGDLDGDRDVDLQDYNMLVSKFGDTYSIFDYNTLVSNFGKRL